MLNIGRKIARNIVGKPRARSYCSTPQTQDEVTERGAALFAGFMTCASTACLLSIDFGASRRAKLMKLESAKAQAASDE